MVVSLRVLSAAIALCLVGGCDKKKPPPPTQDAPVADAAPTSKTDEGAEPVVAYPPGVTPPDAAAPRPPRTGVCSFLETGYDGFNTKSSEKLIFKVRDDRIIKADYTYRGSYAVDGSIENAAIPLTDKKWVKLTLKMTSGEKEFQVRLTDDVFDIKGVAAENAQGECTWQEPDAAP